LHRLISAKTSRGRDVSKPAKKMTLRAGRAEFNASDGRLTSSIHDLSRAEFVAHLRSDAPDWWAPLEVQIDGWTAFTGSVLTAIPSREGIRLAAATGVEMTEVLMGIFSAEDFPVQDMAYASARAAGFRRDRMVISGLDDLPREPIEIVAPLQGVQTDHRVQIGTLTVLPVIDGLQALAPFRDVPAEVASAWEEADSFGLVVCDAQALADAEEEAIDLVDTALAWLAVRVRYGLARLPDGTASRFERETARTLPRREGVMAVRGLSTARRWLRDPRNVARRGNLQIECGDILWPPLRSTLATSDRLALTAARQVAMSQDLVERAAAISAAFEYYIGKASPPPTFSCEEIGRLRDELPEWLTKEQRRRAREVLGSMLNQVSYGQRLRFTLQQDGVPVTTDEWKVLQRVRKIRNRAVHGSEALATDADDIEIATSILSRALVYRMTKTDTRRLTG
jgi:hypothetical protein